MDQSLQFPEGKGVFDPKEMGGGVCSAQFSPSVMGREGKEEKKEGKRETVFLAPIPSPITILGIVFRVLSPLTTQTEPDPLNSKSSHVPGACIAKSTYYPAYYLIKNFKCIFCPSQAACSMLVP